MDNETAMLAGRSRSMQDCGKVSSGRGTDRAALCYAVSKTMRDVNRGSNMIHNRGRDSERRWPVSDRILDARNMPPIRLG